MTDKNKGGRPPKHGSPMTAAERMRAMRNSKKLAIITQSQPEPKTLPTPKVRKQRSDSVERQMQAIDNANKHPLMPPAHVSLTDKAAHFWVGIMESRSRDAWTTSELVIAAALANCQARIEEEEFVLEHEGSIVTDILGKDQINPRAKLIEIYHKRALALMRTLRMGGSAAGNPADLVKGRTLEGAARAVTQNNDDPNGLLA